MQLDKEARNSRQALFCGSQFHIDNMMVVVQNLACTNLCGCNAWRRLDIRV